MSTNAVSKFRAINDFPELVEYLGDELDWPIQTADFEEMTFDYSAEELGLDAKTAPKFLEIRRLRPLDKDQPWGIFFIRFEESKLPVVALRRLLSKLALKKRSTSNTGDRASWHENDLLLISQTGAQDEKSISFAHFSSNPEKTDLPILNVLGWDNDDTGLKIDYVIETLREKLVWPDDPSDSAAWRTQWRDAFTLKNREVIQSSKEMAERLGQLALAVRTRLREVLAIESDEGPIQKLMSVFKENLISDLDSDSFSDMYAQTIAYGLLSARIINPKANTADAAHTQIPITNPFLKELMETFLKVGGRSHTSGIGLDFDELGISEVVDLLNNTNMEAVLRDFGDRNQKEDPVMHFFEGFLQEYDSKIRKDRGVFYTPQPVVSFIVRSVDEVLRAEFGLEDGLADTTTWGELAKRLKDIEIPEGTSPDQAFVQILDPATGTGTFPVEVIDLVYKTMAEKWRLQGSREAQINELWNEYVPKHLLPRLHGYELMMAPYAIAHMKVGLKLYETGYCFENHERARIYLTNALESPQDFSGTLAFAIPALAHEAEAVNVIKRDQRFTVVIGNPPYSGNSWNLTPDVRKIIDRYRYLDGERIKERGALQLEKNLQDDYVKFFCLSENLNTHAGLGVLGLVTSHGFLDNIFLRGMRRSLMDTYDELFVFDLHGNVLRGEVSPDGSRDKNVFDIKQTGVAISIFSKISRQLEKSITHAELWGDAKLSKLPFLASHTLQSVVKSIVNPAKPAWLLSLRDETNLAEYEAGISIADAMPLRSLGVVTGRDRFVTDFEEGDLLDRLHSFAESSEIGDELDQRFGLRSSTWWSAEVARKKLQSASGFSDYVRPVLYRLFDSRYCFYHRAVFESLRRPVMRHLDPGHKNKLLVSTRMVKGESWRHVFVSEGLVEAISLSSKTSNSAHAFPLYRYPDDSQELFQSSKEANFSPAFISQFSRSIGRPFEAEEAFSYIYSVLHSTTYRLRYSEFLRSDFPRILLPISAKLGSALIKLGDELVSVHLMQVLGKDCASPQLVGRGAFQVDNVSYSDETVWVNKTRTHGFKGVPEEVWNFHIGGYQVCEKWLKDRQAKGGKNPRSGRVLTDEDVEHYQKIVVSLSETIRIMAEIDEIIDAHGGWPDAFITAHS